MLQCGGQQLDLSRPQLMGILNITPDSFFDGGRLYQSGRAAMDAVLYKAAEMVTAGAAILDTGGESTRPGATGVSSEEECDRVMPVIERLAAQSPAILSVDTSNPVLIGEAVRAGVGMINDVRALRAPGALEALAKSRAAVCLVHMQGEPATMQRSPQYGDVAGEVCDFLMQRVAVCESAGIGRDRMIVDPGFGFGKRDADNLALIRGLPELVGKGLPVMAGVSRKSTLGRLLGRDSSELLPGGLALGLLLVQRGICLLRTHDVAATADVLKLFEWVKAG